MMTSEKWKQICRYFKLRERAGRRLLFDSTPVQVGKDPTTDQPIFKGKTYRKEEHGCLYCADRKCKDMNDWSRHNA